MEVRSSHTGSSGSAGSHSCNRRRKNGETLLRSYLQPDAETIWRVVLHPTQRIGNRKPGKPHNGNHTRSAVEEGLVSPSQPGELLWHRECAD